MIGAGAAPLFEPRTYCFLQRTLEKGGVERGLCPLPWLQEVEEPAGGSP